MAAVMDRLKLMLMGKPGKNRAKPDAKEEAMEVVDGPKEEMLEDAKGRPLRLRIPDKKPKFGKTPFGKR
jgi:hypothetical protein